MSEDFFNPPVIKPPRLNLILKRVLTPENTKIIKSEVAGKNLEFRGFSTTYDEGLNIKYKLEPAHNKFNPKINRVIAKPLNSFGVNYAIESDKFRIQRENNFVLYVEHKYKNIEKINNLFIYDYENVYFNTQPLMNWIKKKTNIDFCFDSDNGSEYFEFPQEYDYDYDSYEKEVIKNPHIEEELLSAPLFFEINTNSLDNIFEKWEKVTTLMKKGLLLFGLKYYEDVELV